MTSLKDYWKILTKTGSVRLYNEILENPVFDLIYGTETQTITPLTGYENLNDELSDAEPYVPSFTRPVMDSLNFLNNLARDSDFVFYDPGCGKVKVILLAARSELFKKIVGIEPDNDLSIITRNNLVELIQNGKAHVTHGNAAIYKSFAKIAVIYLYNPFGANLLAKFLANLEASAIENA